MKRPDKSHENKKRRTLSMFRTVSILVLCFAATLLLLRMELDKRTKQAALESLPDFAAQSSAGVVSRVEDMASRLNTAAQVLAAGNLEPGSISQELLEAMVETAPFVQMGVRQADGSAILSDGTYQQPADWSPTQTFESNLGTFLLGRAEVISLADGPAWATRLYVPIPGTDTLLFGTMRLDALFETSLFQTLLEGEQSLLIFETDSGTILLDSLHGEDHLGKNLYTQELMSASKIRALLDSGEAAYQNGQYLCVQDSGVPGWSICALVQEDSTGVIPTSLAFALLILLYVVATVAVLLYQSMRERAVRDKLDQEVARNNSLMNVALPGTDIQVFELLPNSSIRLLSPEAGRGQELKSTIFPTTKELMAYLNCSGQWEAAFQAALEQAALGQDGELEFQTMDQEETWIRVRLEPQGGKQQAVAIGTIRVVTEEVQERYRQEAADKLLDRMMEGTVAGLEIALEEDTWRMMWGWETYGHLIHEDGSRLSYTEFILQQIAPTVHPKDREAYIQSMDRKALLGAFLTGTTERFLDYRVKTQEAPGYDWHASELYLFRDTATRQVKANYLIRQVTDYRKKQLEEQRQLEEKEHTLLLRAQKLVESEEELDFVHVIANYYQGIYVVDLKEDQTRAIQVPDYFADLLAQTEGRLSRTMDLYSQELMAPEYVPAFRSLIQYDNLRTALEEKGQVEMTFQKKDGTWLAMRILPMPGYWEQEPKTLWIFEDETDTVNLRKEEEKARVTAQAAEAASQAKSQFLANMSHDIRTPLNAILGMSELGLREEGVEDKDNCFRDIRGSGRILLENINSILDLSKIEAGKMAIIPESYHILSVLHDIITVLRMRAQEKKLEFLAQVDETIPATLFGDDVNISHIIMNLGSNAVKYTNSGSVTLTVTWEPEGEDGVLVIHMEDTGAGIRAEDMPYIFRSYGRLDRGPNRHIEGTGLGLPICQNLAELMDGQLGVESTYGQGSDFWVRLPQKVIDPTPCGPYRGEQRKESDQYYNSFTAPEGVVLVVDDQPLNLKVCQGLLRPYEMEVYTARSGQEAIKQITQVWPDVVFMDHMMPDMDGVEATRRIREMGKKDPYFAVLPIIALTANAMKGMREFFLANGFNDFISKPVELDALDEALVAWIPEDKQKAPARKVTTSREQEPVPEDLASIKGVDVAQGMRYCGTAEVYRKTLYMFREQIPGKIRRIQETFQGAAWEDYAIEVHSLKSGARWIGAMALGDQAERLEMAARSGDLEQVADETSVLLEDYQALQTALAGLAEP